MDAWKETEKSKVDTAAASATPSGQDLWHS